MNPIYCISGLGADERIFSKLILPGVLLTPLQWIQPQKEERIEAYAKRMTSQLHSHPISQDPSNQRAHQPQPIFIGVSFGGMMALEMAKFYPGAKVILISSVKSREELPGWMKLAGNLRLNRLLPLKPPRWDRLETDFLGTETEEERQLVRQFSNSSDPVYLRWALGQVINWQNEWQPASLSHIHGSNDKTFPCKNIRATHIIPGGGHFMVMNRAGEVSRILESLLAPESIFFL
ncbi:MAG TPA: alpha/beta hydrolase [Puia sp.]